MMNTIVSDVISSVVNEAPLREVVIVAVIDERKEVVVAKSGLKGITRNNLIFKSNKNENVSF